MEKEEKITLARIITAAVLTATILILGFENTLLNILLFLIPYLIIGYDVVLGAVKNIFKGEVFDEKFLMLLATVGAFSIGEYVEAVAVMLFYQVGEFLQDIAVEKSKKSVVELMNIRPETATVIKEGKEETLSPDLVEVGDTVIVKSGERISFDGEIIEGTADLDTKYITGESMPREASVGSKVLSGYISLDGVIKIKVEKKYSDSTASKMLELVENAAEHKAKRERLIKKFAKIYTPAVVIAALLVAFLPLAFGGVFSVWLERALVFLVVSCPCALVISVPLAYFCGIGVASKHGLLIKGSETLEVLADAKIAVFDKTGTLTKGNFVVSVVHPNNITERELINIAAVAEQNSHHPIASALKDCKSNDKVYDIKEIKEVSGMGIVAEIEGKTTAVGNEKLMKLIGVKFVKCKKRGTTVHIAINGEYYGHIHITDQTKPEVTNAISSLKKNGIKTTVMLTGDDRETAEMVATEAGMDKYEHELLPAQKVEKLQEYIKEGTTLFVGDGINDAAALKLADVGIAMGGIGLDAAVEAADAVIMDDKLEKIAYGMRLSKRTRRIVKENIIFSISVKFLIMILSVIGAPYPMWLAVFGDVGVSIAAILNSLRILIKK